MSVIPRHGKEEYGELLSRDQDGFAFRDIDRNADVILKYSEVSRVKSGYGGYNSFKGGHTDHTKALVITAVVLGLLGALVGAAAAAKN